jgi:hypothetical protein
MNRKQWGLVVATTACLAACGSGTAGGSDESSVTDRQPLWGTVTDAPDATARHMLTPDEAAGAVARITVALESGQTMTCSGTLVGRDRVFTSRDCTLGSTVPRQVRPAGAFTVEFAQAPGQSFAVSAVVAYGDNTFLWRGGDLAVLTLSSYVPEEVVETVAPLFLGDLEHALASGRLDATNAFLVGYGARCQYTFDCLPSDGTMRRYGYVSGPVQLSWEGSDSPVLVAWLQAAAGAVPSARYQFTGADGAAPLFVWDSVANRYVVVGAHVQNYGPDFMESHHFSIAGKVGSSPSTDYGAWLRPYLGEDGDSDGIPDAFDNCAPADCAHAADCANPEQENGQRDRLGDRCDPCNGADVDPYGRNSNQEAETALTADALSDRCDPVPLLRIIPQARHPVERLGKQSTDPAEEGAEEVEWLSAAPWMGIGGYSRTFRADVAFRYCPCFDSEQGLYVDQTTCRTVCRPEFAAKGEDGWVKQTVQRALPGGQRKPVDGEYGSGDPLVFVEDREGPPERFLFRWYDEIAAGRVPAEPVVIGKETYDGTYGFVASTVLRTDGYRSDRDERYDLSLRTDLEFMEFPYILEVPSLDQQLVAACTHPGCLSWAMPWDEWIWVIREEWNWIVDPAVLVLDQGVVRLLLGDTSMDATKATSLWVQHILGADMGPWAWVASSESGQRLRGQNVAARAAAIPTMTAEAARPVVVVGGKEMAIQEELNGEDWSSVTKAPASGPIRLEEGMSAAFSAIDGAVFFTGGSAFGKEIHRYDFATGKLEALATEVAFGDPVLASAYDSLSNQLWTLGVVDGAARLVRYSLENKEAEVLLETPFSGEMVRHSLHVLDDGRLMLIAGKSEGFTGWIVRVSGDNLVFDGSYTSPLRLLDMPVMGEYAPVAPVFENQGIGYLELTPGMFQGEEKCEQL